MKNRKAYHKPSTQPTDIRFKHLTEFNALRAGESAFKIRVPVYNNPYSGVLTNAWVRGWKRAERAYFDSVKRSQAIQATIGFEEVEA